MNELDDYWEGLLAATAEQLGCERPIDLNKHEPELVANTIKQLECIYLLSGSFTVLTNQP